MLALGAALLIIAIAVGAARASWLARARHADGLVTEVQRDVSTDDRGYNRSMYRPVVTFTAEGRVLVVSASGWSSSSYQVGDHVRMDYAAGRPGGAMLEDPVERWFETGFIAVFGLGLTFIGAIFVLQGGSSAAG